MSDLSRRGFLLGGAVLGAAACSKAASRPRRGWLGRMERWNEGVERALFSPGSRAPRYVRRVETAPGAFPAYYVSAGGPPAAPAGWALRVGGAVRHPRAFTLDDLKRMPRADLRVEHHCVEGWSAIASWHGVRVSDLAEAVGARDVGFVEFRSFDVDPDGTAYWSSWDRASALHRQTLLAYGMDGRPLGPAHGAPLRLYSAVKLGYKNVKYLSTVTFLPRETGGYWENLGYEWYAGT